MAQMAGEAEPADVRIDYAAGLTDEQKGRYEPPEETAARIKGWISGICKDLCRNQSRRAQTSS